jgi:hypothetical protein
VAVLGLGLMPAAAVAGGGAGASVAPAAAGVISTVAGGAGGPALGTQVSLGSLLPGDRQYHRQGFGPCGLWYSSGHVYVGDGRSVRVLATGNDRLTTPAGTGVPGPLGDGGPATNAGLHGACGVAVGHAGNVVIADGRSNRIQVVAHATGTFYGQPMTAGDIYTVAGNGRAGYSGDGGAGTKAEISGPGRMAVDGHGNVLRHADDRRGYLHRGRGGPARLLRQRPPRGRCGDRRADRPSDG